MRGNIRIAVLIDSENVSATHLPAVFDELAKHGRVIVRRMYGDWTHPRLVNWKKLARSHGIQPVQQFANTSGKNATDSALIIDAMDLLHQGTFDVFALVSSDSDFTRLATRIRESGPQVIGFGRKDTAEAFVNACDAFHPFDECSKPPLVSAHVSDEQRQPAAKTVAAAKPAANKQAATNQMTKKATPSARKTQAQLRQDTRLVSALRVGIHAAAGSDGWSDVGPVAQQVWKLLQPDTAKSWGFAKFSDLLKETGFFELRSARNAKGGTCLRVRDPAHAAKAPTPKDPPSVQKTKPVAIARA